MKVNKCINCGAKLKLDTDTGIMKCQYCGSEYKSEITSPKNTHYENQTIANQISSSLVLNEKRPKISVAIVILLLFFGFFPIAILYIVIVKHRQNLWDEKHNTPPDDEC